VHLFVRVRETKRFLHGSLSEFSHPSLGRPIPLLGLSHLLTLFFIFICAPNAPLTVAAMSVSVVIRFFEAFSLPWDRFFLCGPKHFCPVSSLSLPFVLLLHFFSCEDFFNPHTTYQSVLIISPVPSPLRLTLHTLFTHLPLVLWSCSVMSRPIVPLCRRRSH